MSDYLTEAFQKLRLLEDDFDLSADRGKIDELKSFVADDIEIPEEEVIDVEAVSEEDLADNYNGKVILECECCHARVYKDIEDVFVDDETQTANVDEECPVCNNTLGYTVIGKIEPFEKAKEIEVNVEDNDEVETGEGDLELEGLKKVYKGGIKIKEDFDEKSEELPDDDIEEDEGEVLTEAPWVWKDDDEVEDDDVIMDDGEDDDEDEDGVPFINGKYSPGPLTQEVIDALYESGDWYINDFATEYGLEYLYDSMENSGDSESGMSITIEESPEADGEWRWDDEFVDTGALINTLRRYVLIGLEKKYGQKWKDILDSHPEKSWYMDYNNIPEPTVAKDKQEMIDGAKAIIKAARENGSFEESCKSKEEIKESKLQENAWTRLVKAFPELEEGIETCPECGKTPCECEKVEEACSKEAKKGSARDKLKAKNPELKEALYKDLGSGIVEEGETLTEDDLETYWAENCDTDPVLMEYDDYETWKQDTIDNYLEQLPDTFKESVEVSASGEDNVRVNKNDDGSMDINVSSTEPGEGEEIVPLEDEEISEIEANEPEGEDEEEIETEEGEIESEGGEEETAEEGNEEEIGEFEEESFDEMGESYMRKVYSNVKSYQTTSAIDTGSGLIIEGYITFKSGAKRKTSFVFTESRKNKYGKVILEGYNKTFSGATKTFKISGALDNGRYYPRSFRYNYKTNTINESNKSEVFKVQGLIKLENCRKRHGK